VSDRVAQGWAGGARARSVASGASEQARRLDVVGAVVAGLFALWILLSAAVNGTSPLPMLGTLLLAAGALTLARGLAVRDRSVGPAAVVTLGASAVLLGLGGLGGAAGAPLLYANANAALFVQVAAAGLMMAATWRYASARLTGFVAAGVFGVLALITGSRAGLVLVVALAVGGVASLRPGLPVRAITIAGAAVVVAALIFTVTLAGGGLDRAARRQAASELTGTRVGLWSEALQVMGERPVVGIGPGAFTPGGTVTGRTDRDIGWAHNDFLQQGAETGFPGLALLLLGFLWGFARLWAAPSDTATGLGAMALALLGVHAAFDYVLHFPVIPFAAAMLVGTAQASRDRHPDDARAGTLVRKALKAAVLPLGARTRRGDFSVLLYHRVGRGRREVDLDADAFDRQIAALATRGDVVPLERALGDGPGGGVVVTVDDGYRDFHEHVLPVLVRHRVPVTLYLATGLIVDEGGPADGLTWKHLEEAVDSGLVTMGSHTHSHANLGAASEEEAEREVQRSQGLVEDRLGVPCRHFAYPWGVGSPDADRVVRRMFDSAALPWGTNRAGRIDPYRLARVPILRSDGPALFGAKVEGRLDREALLYRLLGRGPWRRR
jgi:peptidoglycan/xylan/chitin deacetylase (PgdA/CDA1 family)/O-antigen ligase